MKTNKLLKLKGRLQENPRPRSGTEPNIKENDTVTSDRIRDLSASLHKVWEYWQADDTGLPPIVSARFKRIVPKSLRIKEILRKSQTRILGVKFIGNCPVCHLFTYMCSLRTIEDGIGKLDKLAETIDAAPFSGQITGRQVKAMAANKPIDMEDPKSEDKKARMETKLKKLGVSKSEAQRYVDAVQNGGLAKTVFIDLVTEVNVLSGFSVEEAPREISDSQIITLYDVGRSFEELSSLFGLSSVQISTSGPVTWLVTPKQYATIAAKAPFLISMAMTDMQTIAVQSYMETGVDSAIRFARPGNEPVIGVIDYPFDKSVPFSDWVEMHNCLSPELESESSDYEHGTAVTSLIVDGPALNPGLDDNCGRFRVRHFSAVNGSRFSSFTLMKTIASIVASNPDIHVWNLSLGADQGIDRNFVSIEAAMLDDLQRRHDILFVISGTNNRAGDHSYPVMGPPADSINSLIVNSVRIDGMPASYTRKGPVLDFHTKPDLCAYGGDTGEELRVWAGSGPRLVKGTSFAAPWISRKASFLIDKLGLSVQEAKALLIDSAAGWNTDETHKDLIGYGIVPHDINKIVTCPEDEIRFILSGQALAYETVTNRIPVPLDKAGKFPYTAKVTLCYPSACNRNNGVDYTEDELDLHFGRLDEEGNKIEKTINDNRQNEAGAFTGEESARQEFRKWDNVKHVTETLDKRLVTKKNKAPNPYWGLKLVKTTRLDTPSRDRIPFSVVVTLREIKGENRINDFKRMCDAALWDIETVDVEQRLDFYERIEENVTFTE